MVQEGEKNIQYKELEDENLYIEYNSKAMEQSKWANCNSASVNFELTLNYFKMTPTRAVLRTHSSWLHEFLSHDS